MKAVLFHRSTVALAWLLAGLISVVSYGATPPANDAFAGAGVIASLPYTITASNVDATHEPGELSLMEGRASVWWVLTTTANGTCTIDFGGSFAGALLVVWTGSSINSLTPVTYSFGPESPAEFDARAGVPYHISVDGALGLTGSIVLRVTQQPADPPPNDDFADAIVITGTTYSTTTSNVAATKEPGEPHHADVEGGRSIWWSWTAPTTGRFVLDTIGSEVDTVLAVYTGPSVSGLVTVASDDDSGDYGMSRVVFDAQAGTTYRIAVDCWNEFSGSIQLHLDAPAVPNDNFAAAFLIEGTPYDGAQVCNLIATREPGEPAHHGVGGGRSLWWRWVAPTSGRMAVSTSQSDFVAVVAIYTGTAVNELTEVASGYGEEGFYFPTTAGTTYSFAVDIASGTGGLAALRLAPAPPPPANDDFADAMRLTGETVLLTQTSNSGASVEPDEPDHAGRWGGKSVWYVWTAPADGAYQWTTIRSAFDTLLAVYTGSGLSALKLVAEDDDGGVNGTSRLTFNATTGTTYHLAVDGKNGLEGAILLQLYRVGTAPANDSFAHAVEVPDINATLTGSNIDATLEAGEASKSFKLPTGSVWYHWIAPADGLLTLRLEEAGFDPLFDLFRGTTWASLTECDFNSGRALPLAIQANVTAGTSYYVRVSGVDFEPGLTAGCFRFTLAFATRLPAPAWCMNDPSHHPVASANGLGPATILSFTSLTCPGGLEQANQLRPLPERYAGRGLAVYLAFFLSQMPTVETTNDVATYASVHRLTHPALVGSGAIFADFMVDYLPTTFVLNARNEILYRHNGVVSTAVLEDEILPLLAGPPAIRLEVRQAGVNVRLSWPLAYQSLRVETTENPGSPAWKRLAVTPQANADGTCGIEWPIEPGQAFFRLAE